MLSFLLLSLFVVLTSACHRGPRRLKTLDELESHAVAELPEGGIGHTLPMPILEDGVLRAAVLAYPRSSDPSKPSLVYPPDLLLVLDVETARVVRQKPLKPNDLLPGPPGGKPLPSTDRPRAASVEDWLKKHERLSALVPALWTAFAEGRDHLSDEEKRSLETALALAEGLEPDALVPYVRVVAKDYYQWAAKNLPPKGGKP